MKKHHWQLAFVVTFCITIPSFAETIKANKTLAEKVLEKYQSFETYHACWSATVDDQNSNSTWEVAFDRKSSNVLFRITGSQTDKERSDQLLLLVIDGANMHTALDSGLGMQKDSKPIHDPNQLTYRDVRRAIPMLYPFDLPLIFSEYPFQEIIQSQVKKNETLTKDSDFHPGFELFTRLEGETSAQYQVDPDTLLLKAFRFIYHGNSP